LSVGFGLRRELASLDGGRSVRCNLPLLRRVDRRKEPWYLLILTASLGALGGFLCSRIEGWAGGITGLDLRVDQVGNKGALVYTFAFVAPLREIAKVIAVWPAYRSKHFDEPTDGIIYATAGALGFAAFESFRILRANEGWIYVFRSMLELPAHVFFACMWGYALGRVKRTKRTTGRLFAPAVAFAIAAHGFYIHLVYGRATGALVGVPPLLITMGIVTVFAARDLWRRTEMPSSSRAGNLLSRASSPGSMPHSLTDVRDAMRTQGRIRLRWVAIGALVTVGALVVFFSGAVAFGHWMQVDFSVVDERDVRTTAPVAILVGGILLAFPVSGYVIVRASALPSLVEPALASALAVALVLVLLGLAAPVALLFGVAFSPVALLLSCIGAWTARD